MDMFDIIKVNVDSFIIITIIAALLGGLRATFPTNGDKPSMYMAIRQIIASITIALLISLIYAMDINLSGSTSTGAGAIKFIIVVLASIWALDILYWIVSFSKSIRAHGPIRALKEIFNKDKNTDE